MLHKAAVIARFSSYPAETVLERSQRANPAANLDGYTPGGCGQMKERSPSPTKREEAADDHEEDEAQMGQHQSVGCEAKDQPSNLSIWSAPGIPASGTSHLLIGPGDCHCQRRR